MQVNIRGWSRDHGPKELLRADLAYGDVRKEVGKYTWTETYVDVIRGERRRYRAAPRVYHTVRVTGSAKLNLNGDYMVQLELDDTEIERLFYLTHSAEEARRTVASLEEAARRLRALYGSDVGDAAA
jgi:hypothetical protein